MNDDSRLTTLAKDTFTTALLAFPLKYRLYIFVEAICAQAVFWLTICPLFLENVSKVTGRELSELISFSID